MVKSIVMCVLAGIVLSSLGCEARVVARPAVVVSRPAVVIARPVYVAPAVVVSRPVVVRVVPVRPVVRETVIVR